MAIKQENRSLAIATSLGPNELALASASMHEELSRVFRIEVDLRSENSNVDFNKIVGQNATIQLALNHGKQRYFNGFVSRFVQSANVGGLARYRATLVPWLWFLTRTADCRIFQEKSVPEIVEEVFQHHKFSDYRLSLSGSYQKREYCVQYRETDFNFVGRLLEQEGIYYFFEHGNGTHTLVLADSIEAHKSFPGYEEVAFREVEMGPAAEREVINDWLMTQEVQPGVYALSDFDFKKPRTSLRTSANLSRPQGGSDYEVYDYPGEYSDYSEGERLTQVRLDEFQVQHEILRGQALSRGLAAGYTFTLKDHPRRDQNREYLITNVAMEVDAGEFASNGNGHGGVPFFSCGLTAIDVKQTFRPARQTPKPIVQGPQTAMVTGPKGEEIHVDKYGRVKVQFHWDRHGQADENSSCWIRVAEHWAGKKWGAVFTPRIGQEVIVEFLEGDPDRPLITGRVYNDTAMPPYELPAFKTISTLKSNSSPGGAGFNEIRLEDKKGEEQVFIHGERNMDVRVKHDAFETIENDRHLIVKNDRLEHVENNRDDIVDGDHKEKISKDRHLNVAGKEAKQVGKSLSLTVSGDVIEVFKANHSEQTSQNLYLKASGVVIEAASGLTLKCGASSLVLDASGVTVKGALVVLDGAMVNIASGPGSPPTPGQAGAAVSPADPKPAQEADKADPGAVEQIKAEQRQTQTGKYGSAQTQPNKPPKTDEEKAKRKSWIEIELLDQKNKPVPGEPYVITLADGKTVTGGTLDEKGFARVDGIEPGSCKVSFPRLHKDAWKRA
jgi:type VI secretion system secreted protein VgrG